MDALNLQIFHWLAAGHSPDETLLGLATWLARGGSWPCLALVAVALWRHPPERLHVLLVCGLCAGASMLAHAIAEALNVPRPFMLGLSPSYIGHGSRGGLPSAHASVMFTLALGFLWRPRLRNSGWALAVVALLTAWARIHVGVHFPADIVAGLLLALVLVAPMALAQRHWRPGFTRRLDSQPT